MLQTSKTFKQANTIASIPPGFNALQGQLLQCTHMSINDMFWNMKDLSDLFFLMSLPLLPCPFVSAFFPTLANEFLECCAQITGSKTIRMLCSFQLCSYKAFINYNESFSRIHQTRGRKKGKRDLQWWTVWWAESMLVTLKRPGCKRARLSEW